MLTRNGTNTPSVRLIGQTSTVVLMRMQSGFPHQVPLCFTGGFNKMYGIPAGYNPGVAYFPALSPGGMSNRLVVSPTLEANIYGLGLMSGDATVVLTFYANLAGIKWMFSDLVCLPIFWANLMGYGSLSSDLSIGSRPSAEDIIYAMMDTPVGYLGSISFREAVSRQITSAAIKAKTDNLPTDPAGMVALASAHGAGSWEGATPLQLWGHADRRLTSRDIESQIPGESLPSEEEVQNVEAILDAIKGLGFESAEDALRVIRQLVQAAGGGGASFNV